MKTFILGTVVGFLCFQIGFHQGKKATPQAPVPTVIHDHRRAQAGWIYEPSKSRLDEPPRSTKSGGYKSPLEQSPR